MTKHKHGDFRGFLWENPNCEEWLWTLERYDTDYTQPWQRVAHGATHSDTAARLAIERAKRIVGQEPVKV